jgi:DnaJ-class molecular chaperone
MSPIIDDGTAYRPEDNSEICEECQGSGWIDVNDEDKAECSNCGGIGRIYYNEVKYDY